MDGEMTYRQSDRQIDTQNLPGHPKVADFHHVVLVDQTVPGSLGESFPRSDIKKTSMILTK